MHMGTGTHHEAICGVFWSRDITGITNIRRDRDRRKFAYIGIPSWRINLINQSSSTFGSLTYSVFSKRPKWLLLRLQKISIVSQSHESVFGMRHISSVLLPQPLHSNVSPAPANILNNWDALSADCDCEIVIWLETCHPPTALQANPQRIRASFHISLLPTPLWLFPKWM